MRSRQVLWVRLCATQGCKCQWGWHLTWTDVDEATCVQVPAVDWRIWGPCVAVWAILVSVMAYYFWLMFTHGAGTLYVVTTSKLEPPGTRCALMSLQYACQAGRG